MLGLVLQQLPAWENAARYLVARAQLAGGHLEAARDEVANAIDLVPAWSGGASVATHLPSPPAFHRVGDGDSKIDTDLESFAKELLATNLFGPAIEVLTLCARVEGNPEPALQAAELAVANGLSVAADSSCSGRTNSPKGPSVARGHEGWLGPSEHHAGVLAS